MKHEKLTPKQSTWAKVDDGEIVAESYFDSPEFKHYLGLVGATIAKGKKGVTIGGLHRKLGEKAVPRWTCDAIEILSDVIEPMNDIAPTKYRVKSPLIWQAFTRGNVHLFGRSRKHDKTYPIL